ncbi:MAG: immunoglobulin domain-containing protein, partial [Prevotellaceae bacterium]|nr:immunoglobulin domain-containing protein [Prevotellaceae bacterium]
MSTMLHVNTNKREGLRGFFRWKIGWLLCAALLVWNVNAQVVITPEQNYSEFNEAIPCGENFVGSLIQNAYNQAIVSIEYNGDYVDNTWNYDNCSFLGWGPGVVGSPGAQGAETPTYYIIVDPVNKIITFTTTIPVCIPTIFVDETPLNKFTAGQKQASAVQTVTVAGTALIEGITVTVPHGYECSIDGGITWGVSLAIPQIEESANATLSIRLKNGNEAGPYNDEIILSSAGAGNKTIQLTGEVMLPSVQVNPATLAPFTACPGNVSAAQSFIVIGEYLIDDVVVDPLTGYEYATSINGTYQETLTLTSTAGGLLNEVVYVRLKAGDAVDVYNGDIICTTPEIGSPVAVAVEGRVISIPEINVNPVQVTGLNYVVNNGPSVPKPIFVNASCVTGDITVTVTGNFEISKTINDADFTGEITISKDGGTVYVRLKSGLDLQEAAYTGIVSVENGTEIKTVNVEGQVESGLCDGVFVFGERRRIDNYSICAMDENCHSVYKVDFRVGYGSGGNTEIPGFVLYENGQPITLGELPADITFSPRPDGTPAYTTNRRNTCPGGAPCPPDLDDRTYYLDLTVAPYALRTTVPDVNFELVIKPVRGGTVVQCGMVDIEVICSPDLSLYTYQWYKNGTPIEGADGLQLRHDNPEDGAQYYLVASNGGESIQSNTVAITMRDNVPLRAAFSSSDNFVRLNRYEHEITEGGTVRLTVNNLSGYDFKLQYRDLAIGSDWRDSSLISIEEGDIRYFEITPNGGAEYRVIATPTSVSCPPRESNPLLLRTIFECAGMTGHSSVLFFDDFGRFSGGAYLYTDNNKNPQITTAGVHPLNYPAGSFWAPDPNGNVKEHTYAWDWIDTEPDANRNADNWCSENIIDGHAKRIEDKYYAIVNNPKSGDCGNQDYWNGRDHTGNEDGGMLFINVMDDPGGGVMVYERNIEIEGCEGVRVLFSTAISNAVVKGDVPVNVRLEVREDNDGSAGAIVHQVSSGDVMSRMQDDVDDGRAWSTLSFKFNASSENAKYWIQLYNNQKLTDAGNDILLDDISVTVCYPDVFLRTSTGDSVQIQSCEISDTTITLKAWSTTITEVISTPNYAFQYTRDTEKTKPNKDEWVWIDLEDGEGNIDLLVDTLDLHLNEDLNGVLNVRVFVANNPETLKKLRENPNLPLTCADFFAVSDTLTVLFDAFTPITTKDTVCFGQKPNPENLPRVPQNSTFSWQLKDTNGDVVTSGEDHTAGQFYNAYSLYIEKLELENVTVETLLEYTLYITTDACEFPLEGQEENSKIYIKINPLPVIQLETDKEGNATCFDSDITVTLSDENKEGITNYEWTYDMEDATLISGGGPDDDFIKVKWIVSEGESAVKKIWLNYTDGNGCSAALPDSIEITVWAEVKIPELNIDDITCNTVPAGTFNIEVLSPLGNYQYALMKDRDLPGSEYGEPQTSPVFENVPNGYHSVMAINMDNGCKSSGAALDYMECGCLEPPMVQWENYSKPVVDTVTCGVNPVERDIKYWQTAESVKFEIDGGGTLAYVAGEDTLDIVLGDYISPGKNIPFAVIYTPVSSDEGKTVSVTATTDLPTSEGNTECPAGVAIWQIRVKGYPVIDTTKIAVEGEGATLCFEEGEEEVEAVFSATYTGGGLISEPIFAWYSADTILIGETGSGEEIGILLPAAHAPYDTTFYVTVYDEAHCVNLDLLKSVSVSVKPYVIIDTTKIAVEGEGATLCFEEGEEEVEAVFSATYTGGGLTSEPIFAWYSADTILIGETGSGEEIGILLPAAHAPYDTTFYVTVYDEAHCVNLDLLKSVSV